MATVTATARPDAVSGLTEAEVRERVLAGRVNRAPAGSGRTVGQILRSNLLTRFNFLLGILLVAILTVGPLQDATFGLILVANSAVGIVQELRARATLERLTLLAAPVAHVVRDGGPRDVALEEVVLDDLLELGRGDQVPVDGRVVAADGLEVDESLLTGESEPVRRRPGEEVLSGSLVVAGGARVRATRVGADAFAARLAAEGRRFSLVRSELMVGINRFLRVIGWAMVPVGILLVIGQVRSNADYGDVVRGCVAGLVSMVPEGLVLLTTMAFAVGVIRLGAHRVLVGELAAVESLARVDVVCIDKTGTLTEPALTVAMVEPLDGAAGHEEALAALAAAEETPNASMAAIAAAFPQPPPVPERTVPFSSARRWSGVLLGGGTFWAAGAPEVVAGPGDARALRRAGRLAGEGMRVLLLARAEEAPEGDRLPPTRRAAALVALRERIRPDAAETVAFFASQGVQLKVLSGDDPRTVGAIARAVGIPGAERPVPAASLPAGREELAAAIEQTGVVGRVDPERKRDMVAALRSAGHVVAMTGDGVNDVLALKEADIGVAMGSGSAAARAVARIVLLGNDWAALPRAVAEGRRVIANVERVASLFLAKTVYATLLSVAVVAATLPFPLLPRQLTLIAGVTIGIPGFILALAPAAARARTGFARRALRIAVPAGVIGATATFVAYAVAVAEGDGSLGHARTASTLVLGGTGIAVLTLVASPLTRARVGLVVAMAAMLVGAFLVPLSRSYFAIERIQALTWVACLGVVAVAATALYLTRPRRDHGRPAAGDTGTRAPG